MWVLESKREKDVKRRKRETKQGNKQAKEMKIKNKGSQKRSPAFRLMPTIFQQS